RQAAGSDGRLSRRHQQGRTCGRTAAGDGRGARTENAGAERGKIAWRCPLQRDAEAYGRSRRDPRTLEVARGGAEGDTRDRPCEGARDRAQGAVALYGAAELPQQLAARGFYRG